MLNRSVSLAMSTSVLKALPGKLDIKRHSPSILYLYAHWIYRLHARILKVLSEGCLVMVERLFLAVQWGCLRFVIVVFPDHTHLLFLTSFFFLLEGKDDQSKYTTISGALSAFRWRADNGPKLNAGLVAL